MCSSRILKLVLRRSNHYSCLSVYENLCLGLQELQTTLILPSSELIVKVRAAINQLPITRKTESVLFEAFQYGFSLTSWWSGLGYTVSEVLTSNEDAIVLRLTCKVSTDVLVDARRACEQRNAIQNCCAAFKEVSELSLDFDFSSESQTMQLASVLELLEYHMVSLMLNLEMKYPFVFGFYARHLLKLSFWFVRRSVEIITSDSGDPSSTTNTVWASAVLNNLLLLQHSALTEYNTLNVMKEAGCNKKRTPKTTNSEVNSVNANMKIPKTNVNTNLASIKTLAFSLRFLDMPSMMKHLLENTGRAPGKCSDFQIGALCKYKETI